VCDSVIFTRFLKYCWLISWKKCRVLDLILLF
jgi:hypothetical protein